MEINHVETGEVGPIRTNLISKYEKIANDSLFDIKKFTSQVLKSPLKTMQCCDILFSLVAEMEVANSMVNMLKSNWGMDEIKDTLTHLVVADAIHPHSSPSVSHNLMTQHMCKARADILNRSIFE